MEERLDPLQVLGHVRAGEHLLPLVGEALVELGGEPHSGMVGQPPDPALGHPRGQRPVEADVDLQGVEVPGHEGQRVEARTSRGRRIDDPAG